MSVTFGRFVKVMSGGIVITDALLVKRREKTDAALAVLEAQMARLAAANLKSKVLDDDLAVLKKAYADAASAGDTQQSYVKFEYVQINVEAAAAEAPAKVDGFIEQAKAFEKLRAEVIAGVGLSLIPIGKIKAPALKDKLSKELAEIKRSAESFAGDDADELEIAIGKLKRLLARTKATGVRRAETANEVSASILECRARAEGIADAEEKKQAMAVLDDYEDKLVEYGSEDADKMPASERLTQLAKSLGAFEMALSSPASAEGEMLKLMGSERFNSCARTMYASAIKLGANHKPLSPGEALSINVYMGQEYKSMNALNFGTLDASVTAQQRARLAALNDRCRAALAKLPEYPATAWPTYRFERAWNPTQVTDQYVQGKNFKVASFWSTGAGCGLDLGEGSPRFHFTVFGVKAGKDVAAMAAFLGEGGQTRDKPRPGQGKGEVLFPPGTEFHINTRVDPAADEFLPTYEMTVKEIP
ncbi:MAG TPA: hypothetical protein VM689_05540 [Aliidongia sp.]|nr:hypothetical protein [Aliidongia sp.]